MSARPRQGSSAFTIVIGGITFLVVGAMLLTFLVYPIINGFTGTQLFAFDTVAGNRVGTYVEGIWVFTGGFMMFALILFIWIRTRQ